MANNEDVTVKKLKDPDLWVHIYIPRHIKVSNIEMAEAVFNSAGDAISPKDILGTQYVSDTSLWIVTMSTKKAKAIILALDMITVKGRSYAVQDYSTENGMRKKRGIRVSIHDLPQSLTNDFVEQWVDTFAKRETPVMRHKETDRKRKRDGDTIGMTERFGHLYTGHRYCYVSEIYDHKQRYSEILVPDPRDESKLIDAQVVLYYNSQPPPNCPRCYLEHQARDCPDKVQFRCFLCNIVGHSKQNCPTSELGPTCFKCNKRGHTKNLCIQTVRQPPPTAKPIVLPAVKAREQPQHDAINILHELLDKCARPSAGPPSPDILKKVEDLLLSCRAEEIPPSSQNEAEKPIEPSKAPDKEEKTPETKKSNGKKSKKGKPKRKNSTSPGVKVPSKKNRQEFPNITENDPANSVSPHDGCSSSGDSEYEDSAHEHHRSENQTYKPK